MKKILLGGSPCTKWSIAQKNGREVLPVGVGWELFENYRIAKEKFNPNFFLYENNKSAAQPIKDAIYSALGGGRDNAVRLTYINSALVSAQNRERFYVTNFGDISQSADRGILLKDVLECGGSTDRAKSRTVLGSVGRTTTREYFGHSQNTMIYYRLGGVPMKLADIGNGGQGNRLYSVEGRAIAQSASSGGIGSNTGLYAIPINTASYEVRDNTIHIKGKAYTVKLDDGFYAIRKLTPVECERLQTMPDGYTSSVSNSQRYKALGNGWTAEVIIHILNHALADTPRDEELVVLSMYDGIGTGRYCLDKMGFKNIKYYAYEIDPYAKKIAMTNYPDIVQCGDAFQVRDKSWSVPA